MSESVTSTPLPAARPSVLTTHGAGQRAQERRAPARPRSKAPWRGGGHAGGGDQLLHPRLRPLEPGAVGAGAEHELPRGPQAVGQPVDERRLGPDHDEVGVELLGRRRRRPGDAGVARRDDDLGRAGRARAARACSRPPTRRRDLHERRRDRSRRAPATVLEALGADADVADRHAACSDEEQRRSRGACRRQLLEGAGVADRRSASRAAPRRPAPPCGGRTGGTAAARPARRRCRRRRTP